MMLEVFRQEFKHTGDVPRDAVRFLRLYDHSETARHVTQVAAKAGELAERFGLDRGAAVIAGFLHDISAVIPNEQRIEVALTYGLEVLPEERKLPMITHQKLSALMARDLFGVTDGGILSAIGCHTTLKMNASALDKVVFVADKIAWDQAGTPSYLEKLEAALEQSLDAAALVYLESLWQQRESLPVLHPWAEEAYHQLAQPTL